MKIPLWQIIFVGILPLAMAGSLLLALAVWIYFVNHPNSDLFINSVVPNLVSTYKMLFLVSLHIPVMIVPSVLIGLTVLGCMMLYVFALVSVLQELK